MYYWELRIALRLARFQTTEYLSKYSKRLATHPLGRIYRLALKLGGHND